MENFKYQEEDEYSNEEYDDSLEKYGRNQNELLLFDMELEFLPVKEESYFWIPKDLSSGEIFPLSYQEIDKIVNNKAYAIGL